MRVLHFIVSINEAGGGVARYIEQLSKELGKILDLTIATIKSPQKEVEIINAKLVYLPSNLFSFYREAKNLLSSLRPDIVHINGIWMLQPYFVQHIAQSLNIPVIITPHGMLEPWILSRHRLKKCIALSLYQRRAIAEAKTLIATADAERNNLLQLGYTTSPVITVKNGIDVSSVLLKNNFSKTKKILFLSRIHVKKGIELLIEAADQIKDILSGYQIIIAGEGDPSYISFLSSRIADLGVSDLLKLVGGVYGDAKWQLYREADFFVLPTASEGCCYSVIESLASGTPVITTKGAPWQDIETNNCGLWIERSVPALVEAILTMVSKSPQELEIMGLNGRKLIECKYSLSVMSKQMLALYKSM